MKIVLMKLKVKKKEKMNKESRKVIIFMGVLLVISASIYFYYGYGDKGSLTGFPIYTSEEQEDALEDQYSNVEEPHWGHMPLTYNFDNCTDKRIERVEKAMDYIHEEINGISFEKTYSEDEDIKFYCLEEYRADKSDYIGIARFFTDYSQENLILAFY